MTVSDERLESIIGLAHRRGGLYVGDDFADTVESICRELLLRRRECSAARKMRDRHYNESSDEVDAYDLARTQTDSIKETK